MDDRIPFGAGLGGTADFAGSQLDERTQGALVDLAGRLRHARVLCVGDVMLDHFVSGAVERVSPEAPVPVLRIGRDSRMLGGAGNVVRNLLALGAQVTFLSVIGSDEAGREILRIVAGLERLEVHLLVDPARVTSVKTRFLAGSQHLLRADRESTAAIDATARADLVRLAAEAVGNTDVVVLSDYRKGLFADSLAPEIGRLARSASRPIVVDPKGTDYGAYAGATVVKPNRRELEAATGLPVAAEAEITAAATWLLDAYDFGAVLASLGADGMTLVQRDGLQLRLRSDAVELADVSGAGDTVVAVIAAALGCGGDLASGARLANIAAGIAVGKLGTATVAADELVEALTLRHPPGRKVASVAEAAAIVDAWRLKGLRIGLTNGSFDLLRASDAYLLAEARANCDRLVVALSADGGERVDPAMPSPLRSEADRAAVLGALRAVDLVAVGGKDAASILGTLKPDVVVHAEAASTSGAADLVEAWGGRIVAVPVPST